MKANTKKGLIVIVFGLIGVQLISFIISYIFYVLGLGIIASVLSLIFPIIQVVLIIAGIMQIFGKFNVDKYYDLSQFAGNNNTLSEVNSPYKNNIVPEDLIKEKKLEKTINTLNLNIMDYKIEQVGAEFSNRAIKGLESRFNSNASQGYKFHSVFQVQKPGCLGIGSPSITYLAVYVKE